MRRGPGAVRRVLRWLPYVVLLALVVPGSGVQPTMMGLAKVQTAEAYDFSDGVVWVLVLGSDAAPGQDFREADTDLFQLLGINFRTGSAAAIGVPRDTWLEMPGGRDRINNAYGIGGAEVAAQAVEDLVGIAPDYVMITGGDGFLSMVDTLGPVTVDSPLAFTAEDSDLRVRKGPNRFDAQDALDFAVTRTLPAGDFDRSRNHQALLLGLLGALHERQDEPGFMERMGLAAVDGIDTGNLSPLDLYRLLNALTSVDPDKASGCILTGTEATSPGGGDIVIPDLALGRRLGDDVRDDARFDHGCG